MNNIDKIYNEYIHKTIDTKKYFFPYKATHTEFSKSDFLNEVRTLSEHERHELILKINKFFNEFERHYYAVTAKFHLDDIMKERSLVHKHIKNIMS